MIPERNNQCFQILEELSLFESAGLVMLLIGKKVSLLVLNSNL